MNRITIVFVLFFLIPGIHYTHSNNIDSLVVAASKLPNNSNKVDVLNDIVNEYIFLNSYKAKKYADRSLKLSEKLSYKKGMAEAYGNLGRFYSFVGEYEFMLDYYNKALTVSKDLKDVSLITRQYNRLGHAYRILGDYRKSLDYFFLGLNYSNENDFTENLPSLYLNIGIAYELQENYEESFKYLNQALDVSKEVKDQETLIYIYNGLSAHYIYIEKYDIAINYLYKAYDESKKQNNQYTLGFISRYLGDVLVHQHKYSDAFKYYEESLRILKSLNFIEEVGKTYVSFSAYYFNISDYQKSINYGKMALDIGSQLKSIEIKNDASIQLSKTYEKQNNYKKALEYYKLYKMMHDSLGCKENIQKITRYSMQIDFDKQQKEQEIIWQQEIEKHKYLRNSLIIGVGFLFFIAFIIFRSYLIKRKTNKLLLSKNAEINQQNEKIEAQMIELEKLNATKDKFFSIISHDLKSPFNALLGFSELINQNYERFTKEKLKDFNEHIYAAAKSLFNLVDNLMQWSRAKTGKIHLVIEKVDMHDVASDILRLLKLSSDGKDISAVTKIDNNTIVTGDKNLLSFILRNLVANAIKFTYAGGHVIIDSEDAGEYILVSVKDNGVGISEENMQKLFQGDVHFTTRGTIDEKGTGLGLLLCKEFIGMLGGQIWVKSKVDMGSTFYFKIPKG